MDFRGQSRLSAEQRRARSMMDMYQSVESPEEKDKEVGERQMRASFERLAVSRQLLQQRGSLSLSADEQGKVFAAKNDDNFTQSTRNFMQNKGDFNGNKKIDGVRLGGAVMGEWDMWGSLHEAARTGAIDEVKRLVITWGEDPDAEDSRGWTPLHWASHCGKIAVAKLLLDNDASVDAINHRGATPLTIASTEGHNDVVLLLLSKKANVNYASDFGWTALHWAAKNGRDLCAASLIQGGADVEARSDSGNTPLHAAAKCGSTWVTRVMLGAGADTEATTADGWTALHTAAKFGHFDVCHDLIRAGARRDAVDVVGRFPVDLAPSSNDRLLRLLAVDNFGGETPATQDSIQPLENISEFCLSCKYGDNTDDFLLPTNTSFTNLSLRLLEHYKKRVRIVWLDPTHEQIEISTAAKYSKMMSTILRVVRVQQDGIVCVPVTVIPATNSASFVPPSSSSFLASPSPHKNNNNNTSVNESEDENDKHRKNNNFYTFSPQRHSHH